MKLHLKQITAPKTWIVPRQRRRFILRPRPGGHPVELGLPLGLIIRDVLQYVSTTAEAGKLLQAQEVLIDGRRRTDPHFHVGLFDVLSFPRLKKNYRLVLDGKGRVVIREIPAAESSLKPCKVIGKTVLKKGQIQYNLHDGKNIIVKENIKEKANVGDTFVLHLPQLSVQSILPLQPGMLVFLTKGKHSGQLGRLQELRGTEARYLIDQTPVETAKAYLFVVGEKTAVATVT